MILICGGGPGPCRRFPKDAGLALATFEGVLDSGGPYGQNGYYFRLRVDRIDNLEHAAKFSVRGQPAWVPAGCGESK